MAAGVIEDGSKLRHVWAVHHERSGCEHDREPCPDDDDAAHDGNQAPDEDRA